MTTGSTPKFASNAHLLGFALTISGEVNSFTHDSEKGTARLTLTDAIAIEIF